MSSVRQEYEQIWRQLGGRSIEELVDLPLMNDPAIRATLDVLTEVVDASIFTDKNLLSWSFARMVNLSLEHGNNDGSCFAYVWLGMFSDRISATTRPDSDSAGSATSWWRSADCIATRPVPTCPSGI